MKNKKKQTEDHIDVRIRGREWSAKEMAEIKQFAKANHAQRTPERKLKNAMLSIQYRMEDYIDNKKINEKDIISLDSFLSLYLEALNITFKKFANALDSTDTNLKKYVSGDRKFSTDLAFKFASFFHTTPNLWMGVYTKNELLSLKKEKKQISKYKKYDYEKVLAFA
jgi:plasmid maintenance system antidote protein VapI